jgi:hypothetical protein
MILLHFFWRGGQAFLQGVFKKTWRSAWCFCGEFVVKCMVKAGGLTVTFQS